MKALLSDRDFRVTFRSVYAIKSTKNDAQCIYTSY
jgi:hypothetical protein